MAATRESGVLGLRSRTEIKICGLTRVKDAEASVAFGAHYLGINFWPGSSRFLNLAQAQAIRAATPRETSLVGVFVNQSLVEIEAMVREVGLDKVQLHGEEDPAYLKEISVPVIKAFRVGPHFRETDLEPWTEAWGFLFDAYHEGEPGGTGRSWAWRPLATAFPQKIFLAGGLAPTNVAQALDQAQPQVVDVCSGVEIAPGIKDFSLIQRFISEVSDG